MTALPTTGIVPEVSFGHRLRIARETAGLEQSELAELTGISRNSISHYENGRGNPRRPTILSLALATGVDVAWLASGSASPDHCAHCGALRNKCCCKEHEYFVLPFDVIMHPSAYVPGQMRAINNN